MFETSDPVERIREALGELAGEERDGWSARALSARLLELIEAGERLQAEVLRCAGAWDGAGAWAADGALHPRAWLADRAHVTTTTAAKLVRTERLVHRNERTGTAALAAGDITVSHAEVLAKGVRHRERLFAEHENALLDAATELSSDAFALVVRRWREFADQELATEDARSISERRYLHVSPTFAGQVAIDGVLDPEGGAVLMAALDALDHPDVDTGTVRARSASQRRADNLVGLAAASLAREQRAGRAPVGADVTIDIDTLAGRPAAMFTARCDLRGIGPVAAEVARRVLCDSAIGRVVVRGRSEVLEVGRRTRVVSPAQRRAVVLRDGGCVFPGCDAPEHWCDAHHLVHWADGGSTDLENLALLCRRHHVACHEGGWALVRVPDGSVDVRRATRRWRAPPVAA